MLICEHFGSCGGCTYDIPYADELRLKENGVLRLFEDHRVSMGDYLGAVPAPSYLEYRNKMEFAFGDSGKDSGLCLGVRKRRSFYEVSNARNCMLVDGDFRMIAALAADYFSDAGEKFYHRRKRLGALRHLVIRKGFFTGEILVNIVTTPDLTIPLMPLADEMARLELSGVLAGVLCTVNSSVADVISCDSLTTLHGVNFFHEKLLGLSFKISPFSFFQTNSAAAELLYKDISLFADCQGGLVFDLYCGTGTISQILARGATHVVGVENVAEAIESARENAVVNEIKNCSFICEDVLNAIGDAGNNPDTIILDPPRCGVVPKALAKIIAARPNKIIYVSCKPSSLVRDFLTITAQGYYVKATKLIDLFPRTPHIECLCLLEKKP